MATLLFDLDGTLIDVRRRHYAAYVATTREMWITPLPAGTYWSRRLDGASNAGLLDSAGEASQERFLRRWVELVESPAYLRLDTLVPGVRRTLACFEQRCRLVLLTMRRERAALVDQLDDLGLHRFFSTVLCQGDAPQASAKIEVLRAAGLEVEPGSVVIGDAEADVKTARALGLPSICVTTGLRSRRYLEGIRPDAIIPSVAHLSEALADVQPRLLALA